jgi:hypothetical protein
MAEIAGRLDRLERAARLQEDAADAAELARADAARDRALLEVPPVDVGDGYVDVEPFLRRVAELIGDPPTTSSFGSGAGWPRTDAAGTGRRRPGW